MIPLHAVSGALNRENVERLLTEAAAQPVSVERRLYYPYYWYVFRHMARTLLGASALRVACLVDARTGVGATTDDFALEPREVDEAEVLARSLVEADARRIAERYAGYVLRSRRKALVRPKTDLLEHAVVHKPYWVARCGVGSAAFRVIVDGATGGFHPLGAASQSRQRAVELGA